MKTPNAVLQSINSSFTSPQIAVCLLFISIPSRKKVDWMRYMISIRTCSLSSSVYFDLLERYIEKNETIKDNTAENRCFVDSNLHLK